MAWFHLHFLDPESRRPLCRMQFRANDTDAALAFAEQRQGQAHLVLWSGSRILGRIEPI